MKTLEQRTQAYWNVSSRWNGRSNNKKPLRTCDALRAIGSVTAVTFNQRPLATRAAILQKAIICHGSSKRKRLADKGVHAEPAAVASLIQAEV